MYIGLEYDSGQTKPKEPTNSSHSSVPSFKFIANTITECLCITYFLDIKIETCSPLRVEGGKKMLFFLFFLYIYMPIAIDRKLRADQWIPYNLDFDVITASAKRD